MSLHRSQRIETLRYTTVHDLHPENEALEGRKQNRGDITQAIQISDGTRRSDEGPRLAKFGPNRQEASESDGDLEREESRSVRTWHSSRDLLGSETLHYSVGPVELQSLLWTVRMAW